MPNHPEISPAELKAMLRDGGELALLDVREAGVFGRGHLLFAVNLPLSRLEFHLADRIPRRATRIVLYDGGEGLAERAAARLATLGYGEARVLKGGLEAWRKAGQEVYAGVNVPSKAFGEFVEVTYHTPSISADELQALQEQGTPLVVLDSRPLEEYRAMSIPDGINVPGAELVVRIRDLAPAPDTLVVVNCAGRTRSIIGAQSLINAGVPNRVVALRNGTMGWHLAGHRLEHGQQRRAPEVSPGGLAWARESAGAVAGRFGVREIDRAGLDAFRKESEARTLFLLDVRDPAEYAAGHLPGSRPAPGGQLVQATDAYMATRGARVVLVDDTGVRATMTASWLVQMGWQEVTVLRDALAGGNLETGPHLPEVLGLDAARPEEVAPAELERWVGRGEAVVMDLADSREYQAGHLPGAWFGIRSRLHTSLATLPREKRLVLTSPDGRLARLAAGEAEAPWGGPVKVLAGGTAGWRAAGLPLREGPEHLPGQPDDLWLRPYDRAEGVEAAMQDYLTWETGLVEQMARDEDVRFPTFPAGN